MEDEQKLDREDFEVWWENEGSKPMTKEDMHLYDKEEWVYKKAKEAWLNGAFKAEMRCEKRAADKYNEEQQWQ